VVDDPTLAPEELASIPLFPLAGVVLLPGSNLPLHVFEARYRAMIGDCLARSLPLAICSIAPGHEAEHLGRPPIVVVSGIGKIVAHDALPDGRYHIIVRAIGRARLTELDQPALPYRVASAELLCDTGRPTALELTTMMSCATAILDRVERAPGALRARLSETDAAGELCDLLAAAFIADASERQKVLEATDLVERVALVTGALTDLLARLRAEVPDRTLN
jgi:uncharacterized protein